MGCCNYALKVQDAASLPQQSIPSEENMLHSSETSLREVLFNLHKASCIDRQVSDSESPECYKKILRHFSESSQDFSRSLFLSWILVADLSLDSKASSLVGALGKQTLTFMDLCVLVETLVELSSRTLPFLVYNLYDMNEYTFHYYVSSLAKAKRSYRDTIILNLLGNEPSISSNALVERICKSQSLHSLLSSHHMRTKMWEISEKPEKKHTNRRNSSDLTVFEYLNNSFSSTRESFQIAKSPMSTKNESVGDDSKPKRKSRVFFDHPLREIANK